MNSEGMSKHFILVGGSLIALCVLGIFVHFSGFEASSQSESAIKSPVRNSLLENGVLPSTKPPRPKADGSGGPAQQDNYPVFGSDGILTYHAIKTLGLTMDQAKEMQKIHDDFHSDMAALVVDKLIVDNHDEEKGAVEYSILPFEEGRHAIERMQGKLRKEMGDKRSAMFEKAFLDNNSPLPGWGKNKYSILVKDSIDSEGVHYLYIDVRAMDPKSNELVGRFNRGVKIEKGIHEYKGFYSKVFDLEERQ